MSNQLPYAKDLPYWRSGSSAPDVWLEKAVAIVKKLGGTNVSCLSGMTDNGGTFLMQFDHGTERYRVIWPVLRVQRPDEMRAAQIQAATMLYHDCKAKALVAQVLGIRTAFIGQLLVNESQTVSQIATPLLAESVKPLALLSHKTT